MPPPTIRTSCIFGQFENALGLRLIARYAFGKHEPRLRAARPEMRDWTQPRSVIQGARSDHGKLRMLRRFGPQTYTAAGTDPPMANAAILGRRHVDCGLAL